MEQVTIWEKITVWQRHTVGVKNVNSRQEAIDKVINCYKSDEDPWNEDNMTVLDTEEQCDTEEFISVEENGGASTIEVEGCDGYVIWGNGKVC